MKNKTTILLFCLLIGLAQGADIINWDGNWDLESKASDQACYPASTILITQAVGTVTASWIWDNSAPCIKAKLANQQFTQTVETSQNNQINLKIRIGNAVVDGTFSINAANNNVAYFVSANGASSTYSRRQQMVNWYGTWDIVTQDEKFCNPDGSIIISEYSSTRVRARWIWARTEPCIQANIAGQSFNQVVYISGNTAAINIQVGDAIIQGIFAIIRDQAVFANANGATGIFVRRQQLVNWVGTWDIKSKQSTTGCYPDGYVTIVPNGGHLDASWVWEDSNPCKQVGLNGKPFTQSQPVPKGNTVFLDFSAGGSWISGLFTSSDDKSCTFASINGASASFTRRDQMVSWAGVFDITTKDSTICLPDSSITIGQTTDRLSISWTWAETDACKSLALSGEKVSKVVNTPASGNSVSLDVSSFTTTVKGLLTLFLDGAVFSSTNGASSTYTRRQENVAFVGTWDIQTKGSEASCYPDKSIIITQSGGSITAKWTWADSIPCKVAGLAKTEFSQSTPSPKGRALFLDIIVGSTATTITRISGLFSVSGDKGTFDSSNGASAAFTRVSGGPSDGPSDKPTPTDGPSDKPSDEPSDKPTPTDGPSDKPSDGPSDKPTPTDGPSDKPTPTDGPSERPSDGSSGGTIIIVLLIIIIIALGVARLLYVQNRNKKLLSADLNTSISGAYTKTYSHSRDENW